MHTRNEGVRTKPTCTAPRCDVNVRRASKGLCHGHILHVRLFEARILTCHILSGGCLVLTLLQRIIAFLSTPFVVPFAVPITVSLLLQRSEWIRSDDV